MSRAATLSAAVAAAFAAVESLPRGHIVVDKSLIAPATQDRLVQNERFTVKYSVVNIGEGDATDIVLTDAFPANMFEVVSGKSHVELDRLEPGAKYTSELVLTPKSSGVMTVARADVTYRYTDEGDVIEAKVQSSTPGTVQIVPRVKYDVEFADHSAAIAVVFLLAVAGVVGPLYLALEAERKAKTA